MSLILSGSDGLSDVDGSAATPAIRGTDANTGMFFPAADTIAFSEGGVESMRIDSAGNVGIGTVSPGTNKLAVNGSQVLLANGQLKFADATNNAISVIQNGGASTVSQMEFITSSTERMRIASTGNVGIGTTTTTDAGVTITPSVVRDGSWNAKLALQSTGAGDYPALFFSGCFSTNRYGSIIQTTSTSGDNSFQVTARIDFLNTSATAGTISFCTNNAVGTGPSVERMRILSTGNILSLAGGSTTATGTGIAFPATQSASSDANTLDDYEEGTFTPSVIGTGTAGTATYASRNGRYTKIGRLVQFEIYMAWSGGTGSGSFQISGLPFTVNNGVTFPAVTVAYPDNIVLNANNAIYGYCGNNGNTIVVGQYPVGGGAVNAVAYDASGEIIVSGSYSI